MSKPSHRPGREEIKERARKKKALSALSVGHPLYLSNHLFFGHQLYGPESENQGVAAFQQ